MVQYWSADIAPHFTIASTIDSSLQQIRCRPGKMVLLVSDASGAHFSNSKLCTSHRLNE